MPPINSGYPWDTSIHSEDKTGPSALSNSDLDQLLPRLCSKVFEAYQILQAMRVARKGEDVRDLRCGISVLMSEVVKIRCLRFCVPFKTTVDDIDLVRLKRTVPTFECQESSSRLGDSSDSHQLSAIAIEETLQSQALDSGDQESGRKRKKATECSVACGLQFAKVVKLSKSTRNGVHNGISSPSSTPQTQVTKKSTKNISGAPSKKIRRAASSSKPRPRLANGEEARKDENMSDASNEYIEKGELRGQVQQLKPTDRTRGRGGCFRNWNPNPSSKTSDLLDYEHSTSSSDRKGSPSEIGISMSLLKVCDAETITAGEVEENPINRGDQTAVPAELGPVHREYSALEQLLAIAEGLSDSSSFNERLDGGKLVNSNADAERQGLSVSGEGNRNVAIDGTDSAQGPRLRTMKLSAILD
ncbi:hypothetical protein HDU93_008111 [Gonapodya sp. JEL0774]|nr:hypothetical protein HDU93_008111 [Gonapodya sp. JEL0774]